MKLVEERQHGAGVGMIECCRIPAKTKELLTLGRATTTVAGTVVDVNLVNPVGVHDCEHSSSLFQTYTL